MTTIKTSELSGAALDWAVAKCEGAHPQISYPDKRLFGAIGDTFDYSTDWAQGGPIIERERLCVGSKHQPDPTYFAPLDPASACWARTTAGGYLSYGPTPLVAAMRCFVASEIGDEVDVPEELV